MLMVGRYKQRNKEMENKRKGNKKKQDFSPLQL